MSRAIRLKGGEYSFLVDIWLSGEWKGKAITLTVGQKTCHKNAPESKNGRKICKDGEHVLRLTCDFTVQQSESLVHFVVRSAQADNSHRKFGMAGFQILFKGLLSGSVSLPSAKYSLLPAKNNCCLKSDGFIAFHKGVTAQEGCEALCSRNSKCHFYSFTTDQKYCVLCKHCRVPQSSTGPVLFRSYAKKATDASSSLVVPAPPLNSMPKATYNIQNATKKNGWYEWKNPVPPMELQYRFNLFGHVSDKSVCQNFTARLLGRSVHTFFARRSRSFDNASLHLGTESLFPVLYDAPSRTLQNGGECLEATGEWGRFGKIVSVFACAPNEPQQQWAVNGTIRFAANASQCLWRSTDRETTYLHKGNIACPGHFSRGYDGKRYSLLECQDKCTDELWCDFVAFSGAEGTCFRYWNRTTLNVSSVQGAEHAKVCRSFSAPSIKGSGESYSHLADGACPGHYFRGYDGFHDSLAECQNKCDEEGGQCKYIAFAQGQACLRYIALPTASNNNRLPCNGTGYCSTTADCYSNCYLDDLSSPCKGVACCPSGHSSRYDDPGYGFYACNNDDCQKMCNLMGVASEGKCTANTVYGMYTLLQKRPWKTVQLELAPCNSTPKNRSILYGKNGLNNAIVAVGDALGTEHIWVGRGVGEEPANVPLYTINATAGTCSPMNSIDLANNQTMSVYPLVKNYYRKGFVVEYTGKTQFCKASVPKRYDKMRTIFYCKLGSVFKILNVTQDECMPTIHVEDERACTTTRIAEKGVCERPEEANTATPNQPTVYHNEQCHQSHAGRCTAGIVVLFASHVWLAFQLL